MRSLTERLAAPLGAEDQTVQSMPDASPTKWHPAHTTWFFETFVLADAPATAVRRALPASCSTRTTRPWALATPGSERGLITRPGIAEVAEYRQHVDAAVLELIDGGVAGERLGLLELGLHHEQQHQELLVTDIHHALSRQPAAARLRRSPPGAPLTCRIRPAGSTTTAGSSRSGTMATGSPSTTRGRATCVLLHQFRIADRPGHLRRLAFMDDGGYRRPELWMSDGWDTVQAQGWEAPAVLGAPRRRMGGVRAGRAAARDPPRRSST